MSNATALLSYLELQLNCAKTHLLSLIFSQEPLNNVLKLNFVLKRLSAREGVFVPNQFQRILKGFFRQIWVTIKGKNCSWPQQITSSLRIQKHLVKLAWENEKNRCSKSHDFFQPPWVIYFSIVVIHFNNTYWWRQLQDTRLLIEILFWWSLVQIRANN